MSDLLTINTQVIAYDPKTGYWEPQAQRCQYEEPPLELPPATVPTERPDRGPGRPGEESPLPLPEPTAPGVR